MAKIYLVDASPYIFRAYFALPTTIQSPSGAPVNAVYGFCDFLLQVLQKTEASHIAVAFDGSLTTSFRNDIYPAYKAQRDLPPAELEAQIQHCIRVADALGMSTFIDDRYESDDLIGTLTHQFAAENQITIISSDKDFAQLVSSSIQLWDYARDIWYDCDKVIDKFGIHPEQMVDFLALQGDSVDNIPGVKGIGPKTAVQLLRQFGDLKTVYEKIDEVATLSIRGAKSVQTKLSAHKRDAEISYELAKIATDAPAIVGIDTLIYHGASRFLMNELSEELGFSAILDRVVRWHSEG